MAINLEEVPHATVEPAPDDVRRHIMSPLSYSQCNASNSVLRVSKRQEYELDSKPGGSPRCDSRRVGMARQSGLECKIAPCRCMAVNLFEHQPACPESSSVGM